MRGLIVDLLERDGGRWVVSAIDSVSKLSDIAAPGPDLVVVDTADFAAVHQQLALAAHFAIDRVVVIGPEPDPAYRQAAMSRGTGAWLSRERVGEDLCGALHSTLAHVRDSDPARDERPPSPIQILHEGV